MAIEELLVITVLKVCKITDMTINKLQLQRFSFQLLFQLLITSLDFYQRLGCFFPQFHYNHSQVGIVFTGKGNEKMYFIYD